MRKSESIFFAVFACLAFASGARGQYRWTVTYPPANDSGYAYHFTSVDCSGETCTATGYKEKSFRVTNLCFRSTDGGETWVEQDPGLPHNEQDNATYLSQVQQIDSLNAVAAGDSGIVVRTTDGGSTWMRIDPPIPDSLGLFYLGRFHFSDPMTGIVTLWDAYYNIFTTSDGGATWNRSPWYPVLPAIMCHSDGGENFRVITYENGPLYSTSDDWETVDSTSLIFPTSGPGDTGLIFNCAFRGLDTVVGYGDHWSWVIVDSVQGPDNSLIMTSTDNGVHWNMINTQNSLIEGMGCMSSLDRDIVFGGGDGISRHIMTSMDHGMSWSVDTLDYASDTELYETISVAVTANNHGVAILGGISYDQTVLMLGEPIDKVETSPLNDANMQIYPNPAPSSVTITTFKAGSTVHLLDILGREVLQGVVPASGTLTLDVSSLPTGLYYISDGQTRAKFVKE
jgi:photosystem II stability/assembly factor-like uncharacterized protein